MQMQPQTSLHQNVRLQLPHRPMVDWLDKCILLTSHTLLCAMDTTLFRSCGISSMVIKWGPLSPGEHKPSWKHTDTFEVLANILLLNVAYVPTLCCQVLEQGIYIVPFHYTIIYSVMIHLIERSSNDTVPLFVLSVLRSIETRIYKNYCLHEHSYLTTSSKRLF